MAPESLKPAYAIWGEDRATIDRAVSRLIARVERDGGMPPERVKAEETPAGDVVAACEALAFGGLRLVLVEGADAWKAADAAPLVKYLGAPNEGTCLAMVSAGPLTPALHGAVVELGGELRYGPDPKAKRGERVKWLVDHFRGEVARAGGSVSPALARTVVERVMVDSADARKAGLTAMDLAREAEKLAAFADGEPVTAEMIAAIVPAHPDAKVYELADAITGGNAPLVYDLLQDLATGDHPAPPIVMQVQLANRFRSLAQAQALGPNPSPDAVSAATGVKGYPARILAEQAQAMPPGAAQQALARIAALELDLRVSAQLDFRRSPGDGERLVLETAARDLLALARGTRPSQDDPGN